MKQWYVLYVFLFSYVTLIMYKRNKHLVANYIINILNALNTFNINLLFVGVLSLHDQYYIEIDGYLNWNENLGSY